jgi:O-antigen ligase
MLNNFKNLLRLTFYEKLFLLFPIVLILRPVAINIFLVAVTIILIYEVLKRKYLYILKYEAWVWFFLFFISYCFFRGLFAADPIPSLKSSISLIRFLAFSLFIFLCISNLKNFKIILNFWTVILVLVCIDALIQYFLGKDIFGFPRVGGERLTGPFGNHQIVGAYLSYISVPLIFHFFSKIKNFNFNELLVLFFIYFLLFFTIALSGERLSFIIFLCSSLVIFFLNFRIKNFFYLLILIGCILLSLYFFSSYFNSRIQQFFFTINDIPNSPWGRLFHSGYLVFKSNIFFGVGLKNYSIVCDTQIVDPLKDLKNIHQFCSTHPHHLYLEILSETGVIGLLLLFLTFGSFFYLIVKKIKKLRNNKLFEEYKGLLYGNILILFVYFWPIKTSGRFFTTFNGSFFWFNLGIALLITKNFYNKNK